MEVGTSEAKNRLSESLDEVAKGAEIIIHEALTNVVVEQPINCRPAGDLDLLRRTSLTVAQQVRGEARGH